MNFPLSEQHSFLSLCVFFFSRDLNLLLQSNPLLQSCLEYTLLPCWYLSFYMAFPFPLQIWQFLLIHYTFNIIAFILPFSLPSSLSLSCHLWLFVLLFMPWALPSHCVLVCVCPLNSPCCCDDLSLLQDSLTSHIFSFSPPPLPLKQLSYKLADNLISMDCPLSWTKCAWQTVVRHLSPCILSCNGLCCLFSPGRDKKNS